MNRHKFQEATPDHVEGQPDKHAYPYWMVWGSSKRPAQKRHATVVSAMTEARRLAEKFSGRRFYVICVIGSEKILPVDAPIPVDVSLIEA